MKVKAPMPAKLKSKQKKPHSAARKGKLINLITANDLLSPFRPSQAVPMKAKNLTAGAKITLQGEKILRNKIEKAARALAQPETEAKKTKKNS